MSKIDRYIAIFSTGVFLVSLAVLADRLIQQKAVSDMISVVQQERAVTDTINIKLLRMNHDEQMNMMRRLLKKVEDEEMLDIYENNIKKTSL